MQEKNCSLPFLCIYSQSQAQLVLNELHSWFDKKEELKKKVKICLLQFVVPHIIYSCPLRLQC